MADKLFICVAVLLIFDHIEAKKPKVKETPTGHRSPVAVHQPLAKPPAMSRIKLKPDERRLGQEYIEQYQDMIRASQESFENFDERDERSLRRLIGDDDLGLMAEAGGLGGRRSRSGGPLENSAVGRRRARSQAVRRSKLHAQSITSHKRHSRPNYIRYENN